MTGERAPSGLLRPITGGRRARADHASAVTVFVALLANLGIALAKLVAGGISRSSAMMAEAFHSFADTGNEVLLLIAQKRSEQPADEEHPFGHGRAAYFWALIAALGVFVTGALLSIRQGVRALLSPAEMPSFAIAYAVLAVSLVLEGVSFLRAYRQLRQEAAELGRPFDEHFDLSSDPIARAVFAEDAAALAGNVIAGVGIGLRQLTGSEVPDAVAAMLIGLILGYVAVQLARRNGDFLIGLRATPGLHQRVRGVIARQPGVRGVPELLVTFLGPRQVWVLAGVELDERLDARGVTSLVEAIEAALFQDHPFVARVDVVPRARR